MPHGIIIFDDYDVELQRPWQGEVGRRRGARDHSQKRSRSWSARPAAPRNRCARKLIRRRIRREEG